MKILHVHDYFAPGNSRFGFDLDRMLVERGHVVHVLAGVGDLGPDDGTSMDGIAFHTYPYASGLDGLAKYRYGKRENRERFGRLQQEHGFDAVVLNQPLCAAGVLSHPESRKIPKIYSFVSPWPEEWRIANPDAGLVRRWVHYGSRKRMERIALRASDAIMVESRFIDAQLRKLHPEIDGGKVRLCPGAVDLQRFDPGESRAECREKLGLPREATILLTLRRLVPRMGVNNLLRALRDLPEVRLVIGGDGPLRGELEREAKSLGDRVRFQGYVPEAELPLLYRAADLLVLPTRELEGFGLVAVEAMACGTPAVGTPVGAIPEVLGELDSRLVLPGVEPGEIARGISGVLGDKDFLASVGSRCRRYVADRFDWRKIIDDIEKLFEDLVGESSRHGRE